MPISDQRESASVIRHWATVVFSHARLMLAAASGRVLPLPHLLASWALVGRELELSKTAAAYPSWEPCRSLAKSAAGHLVAVGRELEHLLAVSQELLSIQEPLVLKFDLHRWLAGDREEAYSDWLAWLANQLESGELVGRLLFGEAVPKEILKAPSACIADREVLVPEGHEGRLGRLDCVLSFGKEAVIVIEVKVVGADEADTAKQRGYSNWLAAQDAKCKSAILLVRSATKREYEGFHPLLWKDLCKTGRALLPSLVRRGQIIVASLLAAFLGAVEINLLGLPYLGWLPNAPNEMLLSNAVRLGGRMSEVVRYLTEAVQYVQDAKAEQGG